MVTLIFKFIKRSLSERKMMYLSVVTTFVLGVIAMVLASGFEKVLDAILYVYAFMVSGLFVPTLAAFFWPKCTSLSQVLPTWLSFSAIDSMPLRLSSAMNGQAATTMCQPVCFLPTAMANESDNAIRNRAVLRQS